LESEVGDCSPIKDNGGGADTEDDPAGLREITAQRIPDFYE